jgi:putative transposase
VTVRARIAKRAENYPWSSYCAHGLGQPDALVDRLLIFDELAPNAKTRESRWAEKVHRPLEDAQLQAIRRSATTGLPYGDETWVKQLAKRLDLDLTIRPRGRPRKIIEPVK